MSEVTPWKVTGEVDYEKLMKEFGTRPIDEKLLHKLGKNLPPLLRRGFFFSHRDLDLALQDYGQGKKFFLYTGRAPSGPMHLGHLIPFCITKWLQEQFDVNLYIQIPDEEKFLAKETPLAEIDQWTTDNIMEIIAVGFDPDKTFIFRNREYAANMYTMACKIAKKTTFSTAKAVFGFNNQSNIGLIFYPAMQMVPTFFEKSRCLIPSAIDQDPYWRIQRDIAESLGGQKTAAIHSKFLPGLSGAAGKMSTSEVETSLYLNDAPEVVKRKIMRYAFSGGQSTVEEHRKKGGNTDVDVSFQWLKIFFEEDDKKLEKIKLDYESGKMLTGELKGILVEKLSRFLQEHQAKKKKAESLMRTFMYEGKLAREMWERKF
ncbi:tryptophan--tRNA ligase [Candidatus Woesearchaeota archaeon]|nr:tryptophan--tRNA ligase [Candidatus Woesearchaeota archaeon]